MHNKQVDNDYFLGMNIVDMYIMLQQDSLDRVNNWRPTEEQMNIVTEQVNVLLPACKALDSEKKKLVDGGPAPHPFVLSNYVRAGLLGEAAELIEACDLDDREKVIEELADLYWQMLAVMALWEITMPELTEQGALKLLARSQNQCLTKQRNQHRIIKMFDYPADGCARIGVMNKGDEPIFYKQADPTPDACWVCGTDQKLSAYCVMSENDTPLPMTVCAECTTEHYQGRIVRATDSTIYQPKHN